MKANELMVGNWVLWKDKPVQVARVSGVVYEFGHIDVTLAHCNNNGILESHDIKSISPIPLTPEILEKNGFENITQRLESIEQYIHLYELSDDIVLGELPIGFNVCVEKYNGDWDIYEHLIVFTIRYVHELQHALRLLKIDKTIEL